MEKELKMLELLDKNIKIFNIDKDNFITTYEDFEKLSEDECTYMINKYDLNDYFDWIKRLAEKDSLKPYHFNNYNYSRLIAYLTDKDINIDNIFLQ